MNEIELWGGLEPTVSRVGSVYQDQIKRTGHHDRITDLDLIADLGIKTLRYPILLERTKPEHPNVYDWTWADERMARMQQLGITPIVGLCHHGAGPHYATIDTPAFEAEMIRYAGEVARRYPHVQYWTPINEPLTTARFSGLYGLWYPHERNDQAFFQILLRQIRTIAGCMKEIRRVIPEAKLVQTEDLGYFHACPMRQYEADFLNQRRWLTWDLLSGHVNRHHPLHQLLLNNDILADDLARLLAEPCIPDIIGINHYVTSERYLGMGYETEIVRYAPARRQGVKELLLSVKRRYLNTPMALTEVHLGCEDIDQQIRWFSEVWKAANEVKAMGTQINAVTAWALMGMYDWHCLLTQCENRYEAGVFDCSSGQPVATPYTRFIQAMAHQIVDGSGLIGDGWWTH